MTSLLMLIVAAAVAQPQAKVTYYRALDGALRMPVAVSPDGTRLLYFAHADNESTSDQRTRHLYKTADLDGKNQRTWFDSPLDWDDFLNAVTTDHAFSADGKRIAVATTDNGRSMHDEGQPGRAVPAIVAQNGNVQKIQCELGSCGGFGFVDDELLVLDTPGLISGVGYRLSLHGQGEPRVIHKDAKLAASCLRISPDRRCAVFFISTHVGSSIVRIRRVDLQTGKVDDSPEFRSNSATFDGRPQLFWDAASEGVYCHVSIHEQSKWPYELTHFSLRTRKGGIVAPMRNIGASCLLGPGRLAMWHPDADGCTVLDAPSHAQYRLPDHNYILGGRGNHVVIADLERDAVYAASIELVDDRADKK